MSGDKIKLARNYRKRGTELQVMKIIKHDREQQALLIPEMNATKRVETNTNISKALRNKYIEMLEDSICEK